VSGNPHSRRGFLRAGALALAALLGRAAPAAAAALTGPASAGPDDDPPEEVRAVLRQHFGNRIVQKGHVQLDVPEVAPDGRAVPVFVETDLELASGDYVKKIHLVVDHNPDIYLAGFGLSPETGAASIDTRIKMRRSSHVRAIVETNRGDLYGAAMMVYVTLNGCV
jgi:sulfur-oxidizing protein SoxY